MYSTLKFMENLCLATGVGFCALEARQWLRSWQAYKAAPRVKRSYPGGFESTMTRREAALILGFNENAIDEKIKAAYRRMMVANHPDAGGSHYLASKINEAKDILMKKT